VVKFAATDSWTHHNPVRITAGAGILGYLRELIPEGTALLVTTSGFTRRGMTGKIKEQLGESRVVVYDQVTPNPEIDALDQAAAQLKGRKINSIVALGGGSVMDTGKVLAVTLLSEYPKPLAHVLRQDHAYEWQARIPVIAIPTTSGTGAEVTPFATVWDSSTHKKHSVAGELIYPTNALLDPELILSLPHNETLYSALDAISHAMESLWNRNRSPVSETYALQALKLANEALPAVLEKPDDLEQRARMQQASLLAGLAISQTRTAIAHSISYPLTSHYGVPHGFACSFTLVEIWKYCCLNVGGVLDSDIVKKTIDLLCRLNLEGELNKYLSLNDALAVAHGVIKQAMADNFTALIDDVMIREIITKSMGHNGP